MYVLLHENARGFYFRMVLGFTKIWHSVPHSGFGIGLERVVRWITGVEHIRECIPFPRTIGRLRP